MKNRADILIAGVAVVLLVTIFLPRGVQGELPAPDAVKQRAVASEKVFKKFKEAHGSKWELKLDKKTGLPRALYGSEYRKLPGNPEEAAESFLEKNKELLLQKKDISDLRAEKVKKGFKTSHVRFQQYYKGVKVFLSGVDVHMRKGGKINYVTSSYKPLGEIDIRPSVSLEKALAKAMENIGVAGELRGDAQAELVIYPTGDRNALSWKLIIPANEPFGTWLVMVDARSGEVLFKQDMLRHYKRK